MEEERKKRVASSSDIFGVKPSSSPPPSSPGVFSSIFPTPPEVVGRRFSSDFAGAPQMKPFDNQAWPGKHVDAAMGTMRRSGNPSSFGEERGEPCHLSSSLLYGGQDVCGQSSGNQATSTLYPRLKEDGRLEGDGVQGNNGSPDASRGNWWQAMQSKARGFPLQLLFEEDPGKPEETELDVAVIRDGKRASAKLLL